MKAIKQEDGSWSFEPVGDEKPLSDQYRETLARYLACLEPAFSGAMERSEFEFILCLIRVRGIEDAGWDPYATTSSAIDAMTRLHEEVQDGESARHLELWLYGHMVEASEPYELIANLVDVATGGRWNGWRFPMVGKAPRLRPQSPGAKIRQVAEVAQRAAMPDVAVPLREMWDRDLRNAIAHAEYSFHEDQVRILRPLPRRYHYLDVNQLINRAHAFHSALGILEGTYRASYTEPRTIPVHPEFSSDPNERAVVMVRQGYGVIGMKDAWTAAELARGRIPWNMGRFLRAEWVQMQKDRSSAFFPPAASTPESES